MINPAFLDLYSLYKILWDASPLLRYTNPSSVSAFLILLNRSHPELEVHHPSAINISSLHSPPPLLGSLQKGGIPLLMINELLEREATPRTLERGVLYTERMGSWMRKCGMREQIAAVFTDESGGWSLACEIQREGWLWFIKAGALPVQICTDKEDSLVSCWL